jgi:hypothetical protein
MLTKYIQLQLIGPPVTISGSASGTLIICFAREWTLYLVAHIFYFLKIGYAVFLF